MNSDSMSFYPESFKNGEFLRPETDFHNWVRATGDTVYRAEAGRYHLYVSLACPWSHRTVMIRSLRKLESIISMSVTNPIWNEKGWFFGDEPGAIPDTVNHKRDVIDIYRLANPAFSAEETVPVLWDKKTGTLVNNESLEIMRMFDLEFKDFGDLKVNLYPKDLAPKIDHAIQEIYGPINNGVYKAGFARTQAAYERSVVRLFEALDQWEIELSKHRFVCGDSLTEADIALFVTLIRFDLVYYSHFKCNLKRIIDYPNLWGWLRDVYQIPEVSGTCNFEHIKKHYYGSHRDINPTGIVPAGPKIDFMEKTDRDKRFSVK